MTPWAMTSPAQFHPAGATALTSDAYAEDFNEVKLMGSIGSTARTADQTLFARFWASDSPAGFWTAQPWLSALRGTRRCQKMPGCSPW